MCYVIVIALCRGYYDSKWSESKDTAQGQGQFTLRLHAITIIFHPRLTILEVVRVALAKLQLIRMQKLKVCSLQLKVLL